MNQEKIFEQIKKKQSFLCVGLDSDITKIPQHLLNLSDPVFEFNKAIVDATQQYTIAYKPNLAFYECMGAKGYETFEKTVRYIKAQYPDILVIADAKRGDIGNTSEMYAKAIFEQIPSDAITVSPYMGEDSVTPFLKYGKWVIVLALTSNKGAFDFQFIENENGKLYEQVIKKTMQWATDDQLMFVVGATKAEMLADIRKIIPHHFLLVPGVGAQGGSLQEVAKYGMNKRCGLIVNSSRAIIFADNTTNFAKIASIKAKEVQEEMESLLKSYS